MATIYKRTHKTLAEKVSNYYQVKYFDPEGKRRSKMFRRRIDAERFATTIEADVIRGEWIDPNAGQRLFDDVAADWLETRIHADTTAATVAIDLEKHILTAFRGRPIGSIRHSEVQAWVTRLSKTLAPNTVERIYRWMASIFRMALHDDIIRKTPCYEIKLPPKTQGPVTPLLQEEVEALVRALPDRYQTMAVVAAGAGLRQGEVFGLTVPRVDFLRGRTINVVQQLITGLKGRAPYLAVPKRNSVRSVPADELVLEALARHLEVYPPAVQLESVEGAVEHLVFTDDRGQPHTRSRFGEVWRAARQQAELPESVTFHDLRHFFAGMMMANRQNPKAIQRWLGHRSITETFDTYGHLWPDDGDAGRQVVRRVLGFLREDAASSACRHSVPTQAVEE